MFIAGDRRLPLFGAALSTRLDAARRRIIRFIRRAALSGLVRIRQHSFGR